MEIWTPDQPIRLLIFLCPNNITQKQPFEIRVLMILNNCLLKKKRSNNQTKATMVKASLLNALSNSVLTISKT